MVLLSMRAGNKPIDFISLTQLLEDRGLLEDIGGAATVTDLFTFVPTASNVAYYIGILHEKALARRVAEGSAQLAAAANSPEEHATLSDKVRDIFSSITAASVENSLREILSSRRFDESNPPEPARAIYEINRQSICTPGNLTALSSHIKSGKSAVIGACIAASFGRDGDTLGIDSANPNEHAVIHFDSEQSPADHHGLITTALSRIGEQGAPEWLRSYRILDLPTSQRFDLLEYELREGKRIHSVLLDGVADYIKDPNDPEEAFAAVERLHRLAVQYLTTILCVIHINPGSENGKTRGHLGSQLARKAESNIELSKDTNEVTTVYTSSSRHAFISKQDGPRFKWDSLAAMHVSCVPETKERDEAKRGVLSDLVNEIFNIPDYNGGLSWEDTHRRIEKLEGLKRGGSRKRFDKLREAKLIHRTSAGFWTK